MCSRSGHQEKGRGSLSPPQAGLAGGECSLSEASDPPSLMRAKRAIDLTASDACDPTFLTRAKQATDLTANEASDLTSRPPSSQQKARFVDWPYGSAEVGERDASANYNWSSHLPFLRNEIPKTGNMRGMLMRRACARTLSPRSFLLLEHSLQPTPSPLCGLAPCPCLAPAP